MKQLTLFIFFLMSMTITYSQTPNINNVTDTVLIHYNKKIKNSKTRRGDSAAFHPSLINVFFNEQVVKFFTSSNKVSTEKIYATLESEDKSFAFGGVYNSSKGDNTKFVRLIGSGGIKLKGKKDESFYTFIMIMD